MSKKRLTPQRSPSFANNSELEGSSNTRDENAASSDVIDNDVAIPHDPPPYSSSTTTLLNARPSPATIPPCLPRVDYSRYLIPEATVSKDGSTISTYHPGFTSSPQALTKFIQEQAALPPLPYIHIVGKWTEMHATEPDFDLKINMLPFFISSDSQRGITVDGSGGSSSWNYVKLVTENEMAFRGKNNQTLTPTVKGGLYEWASRFCKEHSNLKTFTLNRQVSNWNTSYIEGQIRSLIASTGYTRNVTVKFPLKYSKIVVYPPRATENFFTNLFSPLLEKRRYEVVDAIWPYASMPPGADAAAAGRACIVQTEEAWWEGVRNVLKWSIVNKRKGWVSADDIMEYYMSPSPLALPKNPWDSY